MCPDATNPSRENNWQMFDRIAHRYDLLNHLLSFDIDRRWRRRVNEFLPKGDRLDVLDLACGTGDQLLALYSGGRVQSGVGIDLAENMLALGRRKIDAAGLGDRLQLQTGDAQRLAFADGTFDVVTISFGIRNMVDVGLALCEMLRVLRPGGRALVLEFSLPRSRLTRSVYLFYLRHILPRLGRALSGNSEAYRYLNRTIETFPDGEAFCRLMTDSGFNRVRHSPLTFGIATIYAGDK